MNDTELLREYVNNGSETAFGALVERHMKMVYWTCRRDLGNEELAEDATQTAFVLLARKAGTISSSVSVSGWLFNTARLVSKNVRKCETRRRRLEEEAIFSMEKQHLTNAAECREIEPWINDALSSLSAADREIVLLRYFDDLSPEALAVQFGTTSVNIRKRVSRAVERLRRFLSRKDLSMTSLTLALLLAKISANAAPLSASAITQNALTQAAATGAIGAIGGASPFTSLRIGVTLIMQTTKYKYLIAGAVTLILGFGGLSGWKTIQSRVHAERSTPGSFIDLTANAANAPGANNSVSTTADRLAISGQLKQLVDALNSRDVTKTGEVFAPDATISDRNHRTQLEEQMATFQREFAQNPEETRFLTLTSVNIMGDQAVAQADARAVRKWEKGDPAPDATGSVAFSNKLTISLVKNQGKWLIVSTQTHL